MSKEGQRRARQKRILHWAQSGRCAGCGCGIGAKGPRSRPSYPTFDHVVAKSRGGGRVLINGLLKHRGCNDERGDRPPTGCDRVWHQVVLARLYSEEAAKVWSIELSARRFAVRLRAAQDDATLDGWQRPEVEVIAGVNEAALPPG